ncbi:hypothetical protein B0I35DRAFT_414965 [Stachybotrys elegans]|uniref:Uncharacterized protein n=1 Tax=Stachybotrys elegans TaxID=80388 RepID=A0A8K0SHR9_9HYPO|nr:hypothetical protein B0I35DRAFT_414965 [Stachybotrys elegans]
MARLWARGKRGGEAVGQPPSSSAVAAERLASREPRGRVSGADSDGMGDVLGHDLEADGVEVVDVVLGLVVVGVEDDAGGVQRGGEGRVAAQGDERLVVGLGDATTGGQLVHDATVCALHHAGRLVVPEDDGEEGARICCRTASQPRLRTMNRGEKLDA